MNTYAKEHWIPVDVDLPTDSEPVIVNVEGYPDSTVAYFDTEKREWSFANSIFNGDKDNIRAWRLLPPSFVEEDYDNLFYPSAEEVRAKTFCSLVRKKRGKDDEQFFIIQLAIFTATEVGQWNCDIASISEENRQRLINKGYKITPTDKKWRVSWE